MVASVLRLHVAVVTPIRLLAVLLLNVTAPAVAADHSPWGSPPASARPTLTELAQRQDACCKHCTKGQPCGNTCISAKARCKSPPGCAC